MSRDFSSRQIKHDSRRNLTNRDVIGSLGMTLRAWFRIHSAVFPRGLKILFIVRCVQGSTIVSDRTRVVLFLRPRPFFSTDPLRCRCDKHFHHISGRLSDPICFINHFIIDPEKLYTDCRILLPKFNVFLWGCNAAVVVGV